jgi:hypothetical protein
MKKSGNKGLGSRPVSAQRPKMAMRAIPMKAVGMFKS